MSSSVPPPHNWFRGDLQEVEPAARRTRWLLLLALLCAGAAVAPRLLQPKPPQPRQTSMPLDFERNFNELTEKRRQPPSAPAEVAEVAAAGDDDLSPEEVPEEVEDDDPFMEPPVDDESEPEAMGEGHVVQVASFRNEAKVAAVVARLREHGHAARRVEARAKDGSDWQAIRIGPFELRGEAEMYRHQLDVSMATTSEVLPRARGPYSVQVGSFRDAQRAEALARRLRARRHRVRQRAVNASDGSSWHLVRIGPFDERDAAEIYRGYVHARESVRAVVVPFVQTTAKPTK